MRRALAHLQAQVTGPSADHHAGQDPSDAHQGGQGLIVMDVPGEGGLTLQARP